MLEGKIAMVTGVGPGMGRDIALALAKEGADLILVARSERVVPSVVAEVEALGRRAIPVFGDIASKNDCERIAGEAQAGVAELSSSVARADDAADSDGAPLDILVNSAFHAGKHMTFEESDLARWQGPMDVNYFGTLQLTQAVLPMLKAAAANTGDARIIMINTMSVQRIEAGAGAYTGSKAALAAVTKTLALELGTYGIRVNAVHPGYIWGDSVKIYFEWQAAARGGGATWEDLYAERASETALGYLPHSSEIAGSVVFFASPLAKCVTGAALAANGGHWTAPSA